jgi:hypothetical protein
MEVKWVMRELPEWAIILDELVEMMEMPSAGNSEEVEEKYGELQ